MTSAGLIAVVIAGFLVLAAAIIGVAILLVVGLRKRPNTAQTSPLPPHAPPAVPPPPLQPPF